MVNQQLLEWIRNQISQGTDSEQIREIPIKKGYNIDDVNEAINIVTQERLLKQANNSNKRQILPILLIFILAVAIIGGSIMLLANNNKNDNESHESYFDYISKQENLPSYAVAYDVKTPMINALSGKNINTKRIELEVYKDAYNEKRVLKFIDDGKTDTFSFFNINGRHTSCRISDYGEISCMAKNVSEKELQRTTVTVPNDISELLNNMNVVYKDKDKINQMNCALFQVDIDNIDIFMTATYSLTQGLSAGPGTPGTLDICINEETGIILSMKLYSQKPAFKEDVILQYDVLSFSNIIPDNIFILPTKISNSP